MVGRKGKTRSKAALEIERLTRKVVKLQRAQAHASRIPLRWNMLSFCVMPTQLRCENGAMAFVDQMWTTLHKPVLFGGRVWLGEARNFTYIQRLLRMAGSMHTILTSLHKYRKDVPSFWAHDHEQALFLEKIVVGESTVIPLFFSAPVLVHCGRSIIAAAWPAFLVSTRVLESCWIAAHGNTTKNKPWWWQHKARRKGVILLVNPVAKKNLPRFLMTTGAEGVPSVLGIEFACETALQRFLSKPKAEEYNVC